MTDDWIVCDEFHCNLRGVRCKKIEYLPSKMLKHNKIVHRPARSHLQNKIATDFRRDFKIFKSDLISKNWFRLDISKSDLNKSSNQTRFNSNLQVRFESSILIWFRSDLMKSHVQRDLEGTSTSSAQIWFKSQIFKSDLIKSSTQIWFILNLQIRLDPMWIDFPITLDSGQIW